MEINLTQDVKNFIENKVSKGFYKNAEEVVIDALRYFMKQEQLRLKSNSKDEISIEKISVSNINNKKSEITIIIPVYNCEEYLEKCMDSIQNSTFKDFQIICVNDGSTDSSRSILEKYDNIGIIDIENSGASVARNVALKYVNSEYLMFVDSDDYIPENYIQILYNEAVSTGADIVMSGMQTFVDEIFNKGLAREVENKTCTDFLDMIESLYNGAVWAKIFRTDLIKENKIEFVPNKMWEDNLFLIQALWYSKKLKMLNDPKYYYRQGHGSVVSKYSMEKHIDDSHYIHDMAVGFMKGVNASADEINAVSSFLRCKAFFKYYYAK